MCEHPADVQVHHVRKLADLGQPGQPHQPEWITLMAERRRKTLVVCSACHDQIHNRQPATKLTP
jgi:predicted HNH restriction endonuclease